MEEEAEQGMNLHRTQEVEIKKVYQYLVTCSVNEYCVFVTGCVNPRCVFLPVV